MPSPITVISSIATIDLIPKPNEYNVAGLTSAQTVKLYNKDNIDIIGRVQASSVEVKLVFFYPDSTDGKWYLHPDDETTGTVFAFSTNAGRKYSRFLISSALSSCHFGLWLVSGSASNITEMYLIPCRRGGGVL